MDFGLCDSMASLPDLHDNPWSIAMKQIYEKEKRVAESPRMGALLRYDEKEKKIQLCQAPMDCKTESDKVRSLMFYMLATHPRRIIRVSDQYLPMTLKHLNVYCNQEAAFQQMPYTAFMTYGPIVVLRGPNDQSLMDKDFHLLQKAIEEEQFFRDVVDVTLLKHEKKQQQKKEQQKKEQEKDYDPLLSCSEQYPAEEVEGYDPEHPEIKLDSDLTLREYNARNQKEDQLTPLEPDECSEVSVGSVLSMLREQNKKLRLTNR